MGDVSMRLLGELMDFAKLIGPDMGASGYNWYHLEFVNRGVGFNISARQIPVGGLANGDRWEIRNYNTYNA